MKRWVMAVGENPLRILRLAYQLQPVEIAAITTPETAYLVPEIANVLSGMGIDASLRVVPGDAYRWDVNHDALRAGLEGSPDGWQWVIAGGTKPMVAAQASVAADVPKEQVWSLNDAAGALQSWAGRTLRLEPPTRNIDLASLVRLHAGLEVYDDKQFPPPSSPDDVSRQAITDRMRAWMGQRSRNSRQHGSAGDLMEYERQQQRRLSNRLAEADFVALVRGLLPADYDVHGGATVVLRDSAEPTRCARDPFDSGGSDFALRTFEVDGVVVRGFDAWVLEYKNMGLKGPGLRKHAAELDIRRRHLAGDGAIGLLATVTKGPDDDPEVEQPLNSRSFELGRTWHVDQPLLVEAAQMWLRGEGDGSRLRGLFG